MFLKEIILIFLISVDIVIYRRDRCRSHSDEYIEIRIGWGMALGRDAEVGAH